MTVATKEEAFDRWKANRIYSDLQILGGTPIFRGTRISVRHIGQLAGREAIAVVMSDYPSLSIEDIEFARRLVEAG
jgi:uncharacterized protein (DUF433 family)